jgi:Protein of unknown function (DUF3108)
MVKRIFLSFFAVFVALIILFAIIEISSSNPLSVIKRNKLQDRIIRENSALVFMVDFQGIIPAGEARIRNMGLEPYQNKKAYHLSAKAYPLNIYAKFLHLEAKIDSYVDPDKLSTFKFKQSILLPNKTKQEKEILYDQARNIMELEGVKRQIFPNTQDPLSSMFYIQHQKLELGKEFDLNINTNQKNYQFYIKVVARQEYAIGNKKVVVWLLDGIIRRRDKNVYHRTTMKLWVLDGPEKIPILIKTVSNAGLVTARLTGIE